MQSFSFKQRYSRKMCVRINIDHAGSVTAKLLTSRIKKICLLCFSVADLERVDGIRIPLFTLMRIRIRIFSAREIQKVFFQIFNYFFQILQNFSCVIFSVTMREEGRGVRDKV